MLHCMMIKIDKICRFPVKGLAGDFPEALELTPGQGLPFDRKWGIIHAASTIDPAEVAWAPKKNFLQLAKDEKLGTLGLQFEDQTQTVTILRKGRAVSKGKLNDPMGRNILQTFLSGFIPEGPRGRPKIVEAPQETSFTDVQENWVSLINLNSIRDLESRVIRKEIDPIRFRGNIYLEGIPAWEESNCIGKKLQFGDTILEIMEPIQRCAATNVNPTSGAVDMNIPLSLQQGFNHRNMGIYARVIQAGKISLGQEAKLIPST